MTEAARGAPGLPWHQALAYAITGERRDRTPDRTPPDGTAPDGTAPDGTAPDGTAPDRTAPDVEQLAEQLRSERGSEALALHAQQRLLQGAVWPHPVPPELMTGIGYAQFSAALRELIRILDLYPAARLRSRPTTEEPTTGKPPSADLRRLLDEVPPHHGS